VRITKQAINLRRRYLCKRSRTDVMYFEPLDPVYSTKPMAVTQLPFSMNRWIPFLEPRRTMLVFSANDQSVVCYHARFVFVRTFKKAVTIPATKFCVIYSLWILSWSLPPTNPSGAFVNFFSVTSTGCRSDHYRIFRKLCLQKATLKV